MTLVTLGASVTLTDLLTSDGMTPADPAALSLEIVDPDGVATALAWPLAPAPEVIERLSPGSFRYVLTPAKPDIWRYLWTADPTVQPVALDGTFEVESVFEPATYATIERALALFETKPNAARQTRLAAALRVATDELIEECNGRDFFRHPDTGTLSWSPGPDDIDGSLLHVHDGLFELASITVRDIALVEGDWVLHGSNPYGTLAIGEPAFHIELTRQARRSHWPADPADTVIASARGWPAIPAALAELCASRARQIAYGDGAYAGAVAGPDGDISVPDRFWPSAFYRFLVRERGRFAACLFANDAGGG